MTKQRADAPDGLSVVAGATGRVGTAIVERLLARGATVLGIARSASQLRDAAARFGPRFFTLEADLTDDSLVSELKRAIAGRRVDALISAARAPDAQSLGSVTVEELLAGIEIKVGGLLRLVRGVDAGLGHGSRIIAIGGRFAWRPDPEHPGSGIANAALHNLIRQFAIEFAPRGVTSHAVAPGKVFDDGGDEALTPSSVAWLVDLLLDREAASLSGAVLPME